jgi:hypothetical protein
MELKMDAKKWFNRKTDANKELVVMHTDDMVRVHPQTDWTHNCHRCGGRVGITPSGQDLIKKFADITIICNRCCPTNMQTTPEFRTKVEPYHLRWHKFNPQRK